jgi:hypothetical protein
VVLFTALFQKRKKEFRKIKQSTQAVVLELEPNP